MSKAAARRLQQMKSAEAVNQHIRDLEMQVNMLSGILAREERKTLAIAETAGALFNAIDAVGRAKDLTPPRKLGRCRELTFAVDQLFEVKAKYTRPKVQAAPDEVVELPDAPAAEAELSPEEIAELENEELDPVEPGSEADLARQAADAELVEHPLTRLARETEGQAEESVDDAPAPDTSPES